MENENRPIITICIPVYNGDKFIIDALNSIKDQTYTNFVCHIVNNASTDKTKDLVTEFIKNDHRFIIHSYDEFIDMVGNWNRTVRYISDETKYFHVIQADDIIVPDCLESHISLMEKYPGAGLASSFRLAGKKIKGYGLDYFDGNYRNGKEILLKQLKREISVVGNVTQNFYRVEHLKKLPFYPEIFIPEDFHFDNRLALEVLLISDMVFTFKILSLTKRKHSESATITTVRKFNTSLHGRENRLNRFREFFPELNRNYAKVRREYAFFMMINYLKFNRKRIQWHKKHLRRKILFSEYISGIIWENIFVRLYFF
jgi:glycosyltransferase involved in cell wall biosynthesis